jgi:hypothetical protein
MSQNNPFANVRRVVVETVPAEKVEVCPMGPSLTQKEKDGTLTEEEARWLRIQRMFEAVAISESTI